MAPSNTPNSAMSAEQKRSSSLKTFIAALGNFSVQYNFACLSMAVSFMTSHAGGPTGPGAPADFPEPAWAKQALAGAVFAGSFVGMILMGYVGDILGRRIGMMLTLLFVVVGALASAISSTGDADTVYVAICASRFVLGFGVGGIYPMAAATAAEKNKSQGSDEEEEGVDENAAIVYDPRHAVEVAKAFFWQTPGSLAPYIVAMALTQVPSGPDSTSIQFRTLLGMGAVPATVVFLASFLSADAKSGGGGGGGKGHADEEAGPAAAKVAAPGPYEIIRRNPRHLAALVGTGGVWFLYDVSFYGTSIFTPQILASIFGAQETLTTLAWQSLVVGAMGLPGIYSAVALMRPRPTRKESEDGAEWEYAWPLLPRFIDRRLCGWTARDLNVVGFVLMGVCFTAMAVAYNVAGSTGAPQVKFLIFCVIQFSLNWGPNLGTYVQPTQSFPKNIRTTMHGLSAASGKAGAVVGTFMYGPLKDAAGFATVMWVQTVLSIAGCAASYFLLPRVAAVEEESFEGKGAIEVGSVGGAQGGKRRNGKGGAKDDDDLSDKPLLE